MRSLILGTAVIAVSAFSPAEMAHAADLKVLSSVALTSVLDELIPAFEKATGNKLNIGYGLAAELKKRILDGEMADVIILTRPMMDEVQKQNKFLANSVVNVAGTPVSVAARSGAPKPDISSVDAFKHTLLTARSIVYADPAKGGVSGVHFARVLDRLDIAEPMRGKTILVPGAQAAEVVARGEAELGIAQGSEIVPVAGAQLVGPLPGDLTSTTVFAAAIGPLSAGGSGSRSRVQPSSENETPKSGLGDQGPEWHFCSPIPDTETARYLRNAAVPRRFEGPSHVAQRRPDWLAGVAGFETLHFE